MSFQEYIKFLSIHFSKKMNNPAANRKENKPDIMDTCFGLFPFSIKLLFKKH